MTLNLSQMRARQETQLTETVYIQRVTRTSDSAGGWSEAWATAVTTTGRIATTQWQPGEAATAGRLESVQRYIVTLPANTDVSESDRLQISGRQFEIIGVVRRSDETARRVTCVEVR